MPSVLGLGPRVGGREGCGRKCCKPELPEPGGGLLRGPPALTPTNYVPGSDILDFNQV